MAEHVADETGRHYVACPAERRRTTMTVEAYRPALERTRPAQTLFLDFDGARVNTGIWGGPGVRDAQPAVGVPRPAGGSPTRDPTR